MDWSVFIVFLAACCAAAATGSLFPPTEWYRRLSKPAWTPPDLVFPVAWTALYVSLAYAATRVAVLEGTAMAMAFWALQIALNTLWSPVFFGLQRLRTAMYVIGALWIAVLGTVVSFWQLDPLAGMILVPYLVWVSYAGALNFSILRRNPDEVAQEA